MKVLVTGKQGQLVQSLAERARGRVGVEIIPIGRPELDLELPGSADAAVRGLRPDLVINAAAYTAVDLAEDEPERARRINGDAAGEVARAAGEVGAPIIHISTDYAFDGRSEEAYRESAPTSPLGAYGQSKLLGEEQVRRHNPDHLILRTAWVYSPFGGNFLKTMLRVAHGRDLVTVVADQHGNPTSALDLADALLAVIKAWTKGSRAGLGNTYHLAGTGSASWFEFAEAIFEECRALGLPAARVEPIATADWPTKAVRPANSRLDSGRFRDDFGFEMPEWRQSMREVLRRLAQEQSGQAGVS